VSPAGGDALRVVTAAPVGLAREHAHGAQHTAGPHRPDQHLVGSLGLANCWFGLVCVANKQARAAAASRQHPADTGLSDTRRGTTDEHQALVRGVGWLARAALAINRARSSTGCACLTLTSNITPLKEWLASRGWIRVTSFRRCTTGRGTTSCGACTLPAPPPPRAPRVLHRPPACVRHDLPPKAIRAI
jgi:hypothetical protein